LDALENAFFEHSDLVNDGIEEIEMLLETAAGFRREFLDGSIEPGPSFAEENIAVLRCVESVLGEGRVKAVLERGTRLRERHAGTVKLSFVAYLAGREPDDREAAQMHQRGQALSVKLVSLVDVAHDPAAFIAKQVM
jgi:hypothetical protein